MSKPVISLLVLFIAIAVFGGAYYVSQFFPRDQEIPEEATETAREDFKPDILNSNDSNYSVEVELVADESSEEPEEENSKSSESEEEISPKEITVSVTQKISEPVVNIPKVTIEIIKEPEIESKKINSESIVGLNCFYKHKNTGEIFNTGRGSGVIISPSGHVLTARHVVDYGFGLALGGGTQSDFDLAKASTFDRCDVGIPPKTTSLPDANLIRSVNPSTQLPVLGYTAGISGVLPPHAGKKYNEMLVMDYAILKINGLSADGPFFGVTQLPNPFAYSEVLKEKPFPPVGDEVLTYGFPGDTTFGKQATFNTLYLVGSVGVVDKVFSDGFIQTKMEISGGRSGSPLFWRGRVAGVVTAYVEGNRSLSQTLSISTMIDSIRSFLP
jgi:S1-C subfamily serine protease